MDIGTVMAALTAGKHSLDLVKAAAETKDFNSVLVLTTEANQKVLDAQQQLFQLSAALLKMQEENFQSREELRVLRTAKEKRDAYRLATVGQKGALLYKSTNPDAPPHYACQPCLDKDGVLSVLQPSGSAVRCTICKQAYRLNDDDVSRFAQQ